MSHMARLKTNPENRVVIIETVEKAAQLYMIFAHLPRTNTITDDQLRKIANAFKVNYREDFLD